MSLSEHRYVARIAPTSSTASDAVHNGATVVDERGQRFTESIGSGCLTWPPEMVPVLVDHEAKHRVGFVSHVAERDGWYEATFVLDMDKPLAADAVDLLRVGTPVSVGAKSIRTDEAMADLGIGIKRHTEIELEEVSIVVPPLVPAWRGAKVIRIVERESPMLRRFRERELREKPKPTRSTNTATATTTATQAVKVSPGLQPGDEVLYHVNGKLYRYRSDQVAEIARMDRLVGYERPSAPRSGDSQSDPPSARHHHSPDRTSARFSGFADGWSTPAGVGRPPDG